MPEQITFPNTPAKNNITPVEPERLVWNSNDLSASLRSVQGYAEAAANQAIGWYWNHKKWKSRCSRAIQLGAIAATALAGLIPVVVGIFPVALPVVGGNAGLASSLFVGFAAALIGVDKAVGLSSSWARYVLTATTIQKALEAFRMDWTLLLAKTSIQPTKEEIVALLERAKEFTVLVEELVLQETKDWITEFQSNIAQLEKETKVQLDSLRAQAEKTVAAQTAASLPGSVEITVLNAEKTDNHTFQVRWDGSEGQIVHETVSNAAEWMRINVPPGQYTATVSATISGKPSVKKSVVNLSPGEQKKVDIMLTIVVAAAGGPSK